MRLIFIIQWRGNLLRLIVRTGSLLGLIWNLIDGYKIKLWVLFKSVRCGGQRLSQVLVFRLWEIVGEKGTSSGFHCARKIRSIISYRRKEKNDYHRANHITNFFSLMQAILIDGRVEPTTSCTKIIVLIHFGYKFHRFLLKQDSYCRKRK